MAAILYSLVPGPYHDYKMTYIYYKKTSQLDHRTHFVALVFVLSCLVVILANTPMESNDQGWMCMLFSHVCEEGGGALTTEIALRYYTCANRACARE